MAAGFVIVAGIVSMAMRLGMGRSLLVASLRTAGQLGLAALALDFVFNLSTLWAVGPLAVLMLALAGREALRRQKFKLPGSSLDTIGSMALSSFVVAITVTGVVVGAKPWWSPPVFIPLLGMILGNALNGVSISLDRFLSGCVEQRARIEAKLLLGATPNEATLDLAREALRLGLTPMINAMSIVGIVSLPGMMTGQLLAGADPTQAVLYQIVVMYMLAATVALGSFMVVGLARRRVFDADEALRRDLKRK
ncbi:ABC transporter permease [bacterium]|nr:ABC transporter permease [bacterium]